MYESKNIYMMLYNRVPLKTHKKVSAKDRDAKIFQKSLNNNEFSV